MSNGDVTPQPNPTPEPFWRGVMRRVNQRWIAWAITFLATTLAAMIAGKPAPTPPPQPDEPLFVNAGWVNDPDAVKAVANAQPFRVFADTPAGQDVNEPDHVFLWDAARKVLGEPIPPRNQGSVGSCVAFGAVCALEHLQCVEIAAGQPSEYRPLAQEVIYGGSRVEVGGGRVRGDGSVGAWAAEWCRRWGVVSRGVHGQHDLSSYSESRCREYGRKGCPDDLEPLAKERPVRAVTLVKTAQECRRALAAGYPVTVASDQGFASKRDADGFAASRGTWYHQMAILGYVTGNRPGFLIQNSWGANWITGPKGAGDPPDGSFWADERVVARMLDQGDSWAFSDLDGFPARKIDWMVHRKPRERAVDRPIFALAF